jgi:hypothetical protein
LKADFETNVLDMKTKGLLKNVAVKTAWLSPKVIINICLYIQIKLWLSPKMIINMNKNVFIYKSV